MTVLMYRLRSVTAVFLPFTNCRFYFFQHVVHVEKKKERKKRFGNDVVRL